MSKPEPQIDEKPMQSAKVVSQTTPKKEEITKEVEAPRNLGAEIYYAQSIFNGYQLGNSEGANCNDFIEVFSKRSLYCQG